MKSVKRGRGPSFMEGIMSVIMALFGVGWMVFAFYIGAGAFALFGLVFIAIAVAQAVYSFHNASSENRFSEFDITDGGEEPDPLNKVSGKNEQPAPTDGGYCPYCGAKAESGYSFCRRCGRKL